MMMTELHDTVLALLEATPEPPPPDTDPVDVLAQARAIVEARAPLLERLGGLAAAGEEAKRSSGPLLELLHERDEAWRAAMTRARHVMGARIEASHRLRRWRP
jgi:hypothetical protein